MVGAVTARSLNQVPHRDFIRVRSDKGFRDPQQRALRLVVLKDLVDYGFATFVHRDHFVYGGVAA